MNIKKYISIFLMFVLTFCVGATQHPGLFLTPQGVKEMKISLGKYPAFDKSVAELKALADAALAAPMEVPVPKDGGGGYTHEKHKNNYYVMNAAGTMYQITGNKKYAQFVHDMLMKYADLYPTIGMHPIEKSEVRGKLFWQSLNDAVWLVHTANAYDCVYDYISATDRAYIEKNLFYPMTEFISNGNPNNYETFNKMHNHGTWAIAAVGMIAYTMGDKELVAKALYGSKKDGKSGFLRQLDFMFSPDGYFTEGPYYQRYSIWPFITFAQVIENKQPEIKIFNYRDAILQKAVNTSLQCAYNGEFFYLNDALKKTYKTQELVYAVDIAFKTNPSNAQLLDIARQQEAFIVTDAGLATAKALSERKDKPFQMKSTLLRDGAQGDEGGIAIFRMGEGKKQSCMTFKATSHGLSHGHYDKLSLVLYDNGNCVLPDYGAVRFLNIEPKNGGNYTKENYSWGMQSIAHNTVTVDKTSHFNANIKVSSVHHSDIQYCNSSNLNVQVVAGVEQNAYKGVKMQRISALIASKDFQYPIVLDIFKVNSDTIHTLDFPFYYQGQLVTTNFNYKKDITELKALGAANGYQHLWLEAMAKADKPNACFTWVNDNRFYSITTVVNAQTELMMTRIGAGDPNFNLRPEPCFLIRQPATAKHTFASIVEPHGLYDVSREVTSGASSNMSKLEIVVDNDEFTGVKIETKTGKKYLFITATKSFGDKLNRSLVVNGTTIVFTGNYYFKEIEL